MEFIHRTEPYEKLTAIPNLYLEMYEEREEKKLCWKWKSWQVSQNPSTLTWREGRWSLQMVLTLLSRRQPFKKVREKLASKIWKEIKRMCMTQQSLKQSVYTKRPEQKLEKSPLAVQPKHLSMEESNYCFGRKLSPAIKARALNLSWRFPAVCSMNHRNHVCVCLPVYTNKPLRQCEVECINISKAPKERKFFGGTKC